MKDHRRIDERSRAFGQAVAELLVARPQQVLDHARANIDRWLTTCTPRARPALLEWRAALDGPLEVVLELLTSTDDRARRLRQSTPFAGALPEHKRLQIIRQFDDTSEP
jgi:hypothetical protein